MFYSVRFVVALFMFLAVAIQYTHKTDISVGIICMINHTATNGSNQVESVYSKSNVSCYFQNTSKGKDPVSRLLLKKNLLTADQTIILNSRMVLFYGIKICKNLHLQVIFMAILYHRYCYFN